MRALLADECFDDRIVQELRERGYDVELSKAAIPSAPDDQVAYLAQKLGRVLVTQDRRIGWVIPLLDPTHPRIVVAPQKLPPFDWFFDHIEDSLSRCQGGLTVLGRDSLHRFSTQADWFEDNSDWEGWTTIKT